MLKEEIGKVGAKAVKWIQAKPQRSVKFMEPLLTPQLVSQYPMHQYLSLIVVAIQSLLVVLVMLEAFFILRRLPWEDTR